MKNLSYSQIIQLSLQRTKELLFHPLSVKRWLKFLFIAAIAGQLMGFGSVKDAFDLFNGKISAKDVSAEVKDVPLKESADSFQQFKQDAFAFWDQYQSDSIFMVFVVFGILLVIFLFILLIWIHSRFQFVWLHSLLTGDSAIKNPFHEYKKEGQSFFVFNLWLYFGAMVIFCFCVWNPSLLLGALFVGVLAMALLFYVGQCVIPMMAMKRVGIREAWKEFKNLFKTNKSDMFFFPLVFLSMLIVTGIAVVIAMVLIGVVGALIAALVGGSLYFIFNHILSVQYAGNIVLIVLGVSWLFMVIVVLAMSQLPFVVFLRYFSLYFLASLDPVYNVIRLETKIDT